MGCFGFICKGCGTAIRGNSFSGGEKCVMIHVRHGKEMGRVEGHYDEYGGVVEQEGMDEELKFRGEGSGINSHCEICNSEFNMEDSYEELVNERIYKGRDMDFRNFVRQKLYEDLKKVDYDFDKLNYSVFIREQFRHNVNLEHTYNRYLKWYNNYKNNIEIHNGDLRSITKESMNAEIWIIIDELLWIFWNRKGAFFRYEFDKLPKVEKDGYSGIVAYHSVCYRKAMREGTFNLIPSLQDPNQSWGTIRKKYS